MQMKLITLIAAAFLLTIASGVIHGYFSQRWGADDRLQAAADQLGAFPEKIGPWHSRSSRPLSPSAIAMLQCAGYVNRVYENQDTNEQVTVTIIVGPGSTMAIHTPEICFETENYHLLGAKRSVTIPDEENNRHTFWMVDFQSSDIQLNTIRVLYAWTTDGLWNASQRPRIEYAGERILYKIQIQETCDVRAKEDTAAFRFLNTLLPVLKKHLVASES